MREDTEMIDWASVDPEDLIEPSKHAVLRRVSRPTLYRWLNSGKLKALRLGRKWLTTKAEIFDFLSSRFNK